MKSKDQILLEAAYQKIMEDFTGTSDPSMLKPEEVSANEQEKEMRQDKTFTLNNILAAFKQQGNTIVSPLEKSNNGVLVKRRRRVAASTYNKTTEFPEELNDLQGSKLFLIQKDLGILNKAIRTAQVGSSVKVSKAILEVKNDKAVVYMINDVSNKVVFTRQIFDTESLYKVVDEFNKFAK